VIKQVLLLPMTLFIAEEEFLNGVAWLNAMDTILQDKRKCLETSLERNTIFINDCRSSCSPFLFFLFC